MKNGLFRAGIVILAATSLTACATVTRGTRQKFAIISTPAGAEAELVGLGLRCTTPCGLKLKRKDKFTVKIVKEGYESASVDVRSRVKGGGAAGFTGNVLIGGLIGGVVDGSNGAMLDLLPNPVTVTLKPIEAAAPAADAAAASSAAPALPSADMTQAPTPAAAAAPTVEAAPAAPAAAAPVASPPAPPAEAPK